MAPARSPLPGEDLCPVHARIEERQRRAETLSLACGKSGEHGQAIQPPGWVLRDGVHLMQGRDCEAAFLSTRKSVTARVPRRASPPGSASSLRATRRGRMEERSWQRLASPAGLTFFPKV